MVNKQFYKPKKGFTLIEILVSVVIISLLSTIGLTAYSRARLSARDAKRKADLESIRSALEMSRADCGVYAEGTLLGGGLGMFLQSGENITCGTNTYLTIPADPLAGRRYIYHRKSEMVYVICAALETQTSHNDACILNSFLPCQYDPANSTNCSYAVYNP